MRVYTSIFPKMSNLSLDPVIAYFRSFGVRKSIMSMKPCQDRPFKDYKPILLEKST